MSMAKKIMVYDVKDETFVLTQKKTLDIYKRRFKKNKGETKAACK